MTKKERLRIREKARRLGEQKKISARIVRQVRAMAKVYGVPVILTDKEPDCFGYLDHDCIVKGASIYLSTKVTFNGKTLEDMGPEDTAITALHEYAHLLQLVRNMQELTTSPAGAIYNDMDDGEKYYSAKQRKLALRHVLAYETDAELFALDYLRRSGFKTNWTRAYRRANGSLLHGVLLLRYGLALNSYQRRRVLKELAITKNTLYVDSPELRSRLDEIIRRDREKLQLRSLGYWKSPTEYVKVAKH